MARQGKKNVTRADYSGISAYVISLLILGLNFNDYVN